MINFTATKRGRIDKILAIELKDYNMSRTYIQNLIQNGNIKVNNKIISSNYNLKINDKLSIIIPKKTNLDLKAKDIKFDIIYEDSDFAIIDKPNNLVVHPSNGHMSISLVHGLLYRIKDLSDINGIIRPGIVHRIDKKTTGLLIVAKNNKSHVFLSKQIQEKKIKRFYYALVHGTFTNKTGTIDAPIGRNPSDRKKMTVINKNSKSAITKFIVIKTFTNSSLVECELLTGRTHQIRVHFKYINHPLIGDNDYGWLSDQNNIYGQYLHAHMLRLIHPNTNKKMEFKAKLPKEFLQKIDELEKEKSKI